MPNTYDIGDLIRLSGLFTISQVPTDPSSITLLIIRPSRATGTYTYAGGDVKRAGTGSYYMDVSLDEEGRWDYRFAGTGTVQSAGDNKFLVRRTEFF